MPKHRLLQHSSDVGLETNKCASCTERTATKIQALPENAETQDVSPWESGDEANEVGEHKTCCKCSLPYVDSQG